MPPAAAPVGRPNATHGWRPSHWRLVSRRRTQRMRQIRPSAVHPPCGRRSAQPPSRPAGNDQSAHCVFRRRSRAKRFELWLPLLIAARLKIILDEHFNYLNEKDNANAAATAAAATVAAAADVASAATATCPISGTPQYLGQSDQEHANAQDLGGCPPFD